MTHKQRVLALLSDRQPHSHHELYELGCVAHSRVSDLRRDGHRISQWRDGDVYLYRLDVLAEAAVATAPKERGLSAASASTPILGGPSLAWVQPDEAASPTGGGVLTLFDEATI